jgi:hypothetical protein
MQVNAPSSLLQILLAAPAKRDTPASFATEPAILSAPPASALETPVQSVQMLVALAAVTPAPGIERRRRLAKDAQKALDALEMLQVALVVGVGHAEPAAQLKEWVDGRTAPDDPALAGIMDEIDLRAQVELAKLKRRSSE